LIDAAGVRRTDHVLEVGAGAGTVARNIPPCASLTVIELDSRLIGTLRRNAPTARVINADALAMVDALRFDVLIANLPYTVTESLIDILPGLPFRTAVVAVGEGSDLGGLSGNFEISEVTRVFGADFIPPQPTVSRILRIARTTP
jgi:16S rRNA A1518/A1519 N6-dimethyltransferase RsmA/KsgA/DIM1 with predicted DNA glycosylase/AP lyase activity